MDDRVEERVAADVTPSSGRVTAFVGLLRHVESPHKRPHGLAMFADLDEHVAVDLRERISGQSAS